MVKRRNGGSANVGGQKVSSATTHDIAKTNIVDPQPGLNSGKSYSASYILISCICEITAKLIVKNRWGCQNFLLNFMFLAVCLKYHGNISIVTY